MKTKVNKPKRTPVRRRRSIGEEVISKSVAKRLAVQMPDGCFGCGASTRITTHGRWCDQCGGVLIVRSGSIGFYVRLVASFEDLIFKGLGTDGAILLLKDASLADYTVSWWGEKIKRVDGVDVKVPYLWTITAATIPGMLKSLNETPGAPRPIRWVAGPSIEKSESAALRI